MAATLSVAYSARFIHDVFFNGQPKGLPRTPHEPPRYMRVPVEILVALCILVGLAPQYIVGDLLAVASSCRAGRAFTTIQFVYLAWGEFATADECNGDDLRYFVVLESQALISFPGRVARAESSAVV